MAKEFKRWQTKSTIDALKYRRVIVITGARQSGKTTLSQQVLPDKNDYRTLDDTDMLRIALSDPKGFVQNNSGTMVIDEIQKAPGLIPEIKQAVDRDKRPGQYILTGSANILSLPIISDSLAGRAKYINLRPLSTGEVLRKAPSFLKKAFKGDFPDKITGYNKKDIIELAFRGGFPEAVALKNTRQRKDWHNDYIQTILTRDLKDISNIRRLDVLQNLFKILASWSGKFMEVSSISSSLAVNKITLDSYINTLVLMYMFERVPPWLKTDYDRVGKRSKLYALDTGVLSSILGWNQNEVFLNADTSGKLIETFVFQELSAQIGLDSKYSLTQYRDRLDREIDFLVERQSADNEKGAVLGIEVKAGHNVSAEDFKHQKWFEENILKFKKPYMGLVLYSGERVIRFNKNMIAVPTAALWEV